MPHPDAYIDPPKSGGWQMVGGYQLSDMSGLWCNPRTRADVQSTADYDAATQNSLTVAAHIHNLFGNPWNEYRWVVRNYGADPNGWYRW